MEDQYLSCVGKRTRAQTVLHLERLYRESKGSDNEIKRSKNNNGGVDEETAPPNVSSTKLAAEKTIGEFVPDFEVVEMKENDPITDVGGSASAGEIKEKDAIRDDHVFEGLYSASELKEKDAISDFTGEIKEKDAITDDVLISPGFDRE